MEFGSIKPSVLTQGKNIMEAVRPTQTPRQRAWLAIRNNANEFTVADIAQFAAMKRQSAQEYITGLVNAEIVGILRKEKIHNHSKSITKIFYRLRKDLGYTAPSVTKEGKILSKMTGNKAMWNVLRITKQSVNAHELINLASNDEISITLRTANQYLCSLHSAGYLVVSKAAKNSGGQAKYKLLPNMDTGPNAPQIQRAKQVFDPNRNQVMFSERPELEEELKHGTILPNEEEINDE